MVMDIAVIVIIVLSIALGIKTGFVRTFAHAVGWILSLVLGFAFATPVAEFLKSKTAVYDTILETLTEKFVGATSNVTESLNALPRILADSFANLTHTITVNAATNIADFVFIVLSFLIVVVIVKIVLLIFVELFSRKNRDGVIGFADGLFGALAGALRGFVIVYILLALLVPVLNLIDSSALDTVVGWLGSSYIAGDMYDNNLILLIIRDFIA